MLTVEKLPVMMVVEVEVMTEMMMKLITVAGVELVVTVEMMVRSDGDVAELSVKVVVVMVIKMEVVAVVEMEQ